MYIFNISKQDRKFARPDMDAETPQHNTHQRLALDMVTSKEVTVESPAGKGDNSDDSVVPASYWIENDEGKEPVGLLWREGQLKPFVRLLFQPDGANRLFSR